MKQANYCCDGGCVTVKIGKRNFIHYNNGVGDGDYKVFEFESDQEFEEYCAKHYIRDPYYKGSATFYNAEVLDYDCSTNANTLFKLKGWYAIYNNNNRLDYNRCGDVYFVKISDKR